jgi:hypothetical protein
MSPFYVSYYGGGHEDWDELLTLLFNLTEYHRDPSLGCLVGALDEGHPLDVAVLQGLNYVEIPGDNDFKPWNNYTVEVERHDGRAIREGTSWHFYSKWQVFVLDALEVLNSTRTNHVTGKSWEWGRSEKLHASKLESYTALFDSIADYQMKEQLVLVLNTDGFRGRFLDGERWKRINESTDNVAREIYGRFSDNDWIEFLRVVVEMHVAYIDNERLSLSKQSKELIQSLVEMLMAAKGVDFKSISARYDGKFKGRPHRCREHKTVILPGELERIFPNEDEQAIEHGRGLLAAYVREMNEQLTNPLPTGIANELVDELIDAGQELVLSHMHEIDHLWNNPRLHSASSSWAHTRSFVTAVEELGRQWFGKPKLDSILPAAFGPEYNRLRTKLGPSVTRARSYEDYLEKMKRIMGRSEQSRPIDLCGSHLVAVHLARNFLSHRIKTDFDSLGRTYVYLHQSIGFTFLSMFAKHRQSIETRPPSSRRC